MRKEPLRRAKPTARRETGEGEIHLVVAFAVDIDVTDKRFHSNLAIAPTCDIVSTYHITDNARDPQRGLSRATYLLKVSRRAAVPNEEES